METICKTFGEESACFHELDVICVSKTLQYVGWEACRHVWTGLCTARNSINLYEPKLCNAGFHQHVNLCSKQGRSEKDPPITVRNDQKMSISNDAAIAVALDFLPIVFCED